jgi:hypothetical protein
MELRLRVFYITTIIVAVVDLVLFLKPYFEEDINRIYSSLRRRADAVTDANKANKKTKAAAKSQCRSEAQKIAFAL